MNSKQILSILLVFILILFLILNNYNLENFENTLSKEEVIEENNEEIYYDEAGKITGIKTKYMGKLDYNNKVVAEFCKKLNKLDDPNEHNLLFKDFADKLILKKQKIIEDLKSQIEELQKNETINDLKKINNFSIAKDDKIKKQLKAIDGAKKALASNNKIMLNLT